MKYIRTKYGIFERMFPNDEQRISFDHKTIEPAYYTTKNDWVAKRDVIKQADNIKELCDDFVVCHSEVNNGLPFICPKKNDLLENMFKLWIYYKISPYGAIWTDKGLIYVAKLNDKGEWELI